MKLLAMFATSVAILAAAPYASAQQTTIRDSRGSTIGTATRTGSTTVFRDSRGSTTGTATQTGNTTTFRDNRGSTIGTSTAPN